MRLSRRPATLACAAAVLALLTACSTSTAGHPDAPTAPLNSSTPAPVVTTPPTAPPSSPAASSSSATTAPPPTRAPSPTRSASSAASASALPLTYSTGSATRVITVVAAHTWDTTATLQAWTKAAGGWVKHGPAVTAHLGSQGMTTSPSESKSATPMGSFTLTQAFGRDANPGTSLPYTQTTPDDWWISQTSGPGAALYNTRQRCAASCSFVRGDPNEHLYYETPFYDYAVVIDYNTANAPGGVKLGAGSAFFLHVTNGTPTAGCVAIPADTLVSLMRWLDPATHPRILIGTG